MINKRTDEFNPHTFCSFQIKSHDQPNRMDIYETTVEVMENQITKLRKLLHFQASDEPQGLIYSGSNTQRATPSNKRCN